MLYKLERVAYQSSSQDDSTLSVAIATMRGHEFTDESLHHGIDPGNRCAVAYPLIAWLMGIVVEQELQRSEDQALTLTFGGRPDPCGPMQASSRSTGSRFRPVHPTDTQNQENACHH